jgi:tRNA(Ile)-lysidine synthase
MMDFLKLQKVLLEFCRLDMTLPLLVGVSGGPDSLCLMDALHQLGWKSVIACFDHGLRPGSNVEVQIVESAARERGLDFVKGALNIRSFAKKEKLSLEEAGRNARYNFLFEQARLCHAQAVAVAHTADDQVETVLMHFLRGAGLVGLRGMSFHKILPEWDAHLPLVRPLLGIWREEVMNYCQLQELHPIMDTSNQDTTFFRNRLRHNLLPILREYNPQIKLALWRTAQSLAGDYADLATELNRQLSATLLQSGEGIVRLSFTAVKALSLGMQRGLLRQVTSRLRPGLTNIGFEAVDRVLKFIQYPTRRKQIDWIGGLQIFLEGDTLIIADKDAQLIIDTLPQLGTHLPALNIPGRTELGDGWQLEADVFESGDGKQQIEQIDPFQAVLDADKLTHPLVMRTGRAGDRFKPMGMAGHSLKLSDFFINVHLQQRARARWPLFCSGDEIAWIPGYRSAHPFQITHHTRRIIHLNLVKVG